jgi:outer membrane protein
MAFEASKEDLNSTKNNIALSIANLYLQALLAEKLEESAVKQLEMTRAQRERIQKLVDAGALSIDNLLNIKAQESSEELSLVNARNTTTNALVNLALQLQLPDPGSFHIKQATQLDLKAPLEIGIQALYAQAQQRMPELKAAQLREKQALHGLLAARASRYPSLRGFANMSTVYSSTNRSFLTDQPPVITGTVPVGYLENDPTQLVVRPVLSYPTTLVPRFTQWGDNLGYGLGLSLSIPIANGAQVETQIRRAAQSATQARLQTQTTRNQLFSDVTRAITEYRAALARVEANQRNLEAQRENYNFSERRQEQGLINPVEFTTIKNRLQIAEVNLEQARYEMLFRAKVIDFYLGRPIILE